MSDQEFFLYRVEYIEHTEHVVEWVWFKNDEEARDYIPYQAEEQIAGYNFRRATKEESDLYEEGFQDGLGFGTAEARMEANNGVSYRLDNFEASLEGMKMDSTKIFTCGECGEKNLEFEVHAATTGNYYVSIEKDGVLWHICRNCGYDCRHDWTHFSRDYCACGSMHDYCDTCGEALGCKYNEEDTWDSPYKRKNK